MCVGHACSFVQCLVTDLSTHRTPVWAISRRPRTLWAIHRVVYMYTNMITIRFRMVPIIPSIAKTLSSLLSFSWPPLSSSFPLVITILVENVFIFLPRLTEQRIRRRAGGARGTQQSHSLAGARGPGAGGRRGRGEGGGCRWLLPHSPGQRRPAGRRRLRLAAGRGTPFTLLMSPSAAGEVCAQPGRLRAAPRGSSCPAQGLGGRTGRDGDRGGGAHGGGEGRGPATSGPCKGGAPRRRRSAKVNAPCEGAACRPSLQA